VCLSVSLACLAALLVAFLYANKIVHEIDFMQGPICTHTLTCQCALGWASSFILGKFQTVPKSGLRKMFLQRNILAVRKKLADIV